MTARPAIDRPGSVPLLDAIDRQLLDDFQRDFPLTAQPFAGIAGRIGTTEEEALARLSRLQAAGLIGRIGAVLAPHRAGWSTLGAMAVPEDALEEVAPLVNGYEEVNHNYEREHEFNLWFVVTAPSRERVEAVLGEIETQTRLSVLDLPLVEAYCLDLGFALSWT